MIQIMQKTISARTVDVLTKLPEDTGWIDLVAPTEREIRMAAEALGIEASVLSAPLDDEEQPRIEIGKDYLLIILDLPHLERDLDDTLVYQTYPLGIVLTDTAIATVSLFDTAVMRDFREGKVSDFSTGKRARFTLQIVREIAAYYLSSLRRLDDMSLSLERSLRQSMRNEELVQMLALGKSLVYFSTSLKSNQVVLRRMTRLPVFKTYEDDVDLLDDVMVEVEQAIEMADIYMNILNSTMDAFASLISNNLNVVMKVLTSVTIVLSIPTLVASLWGMNVPVPWQTDWYGFAVVIGLSLVISIIAVWYLWRKRLF